MEIEKHKLAIKEIERILEKRKLIVQILVLLSLLVIFIVFYSVIRYKYSIGGWLIVLFLYLVLPAIFIHDYKWIFKRFKRHQELVEKLENNKIALKAEEEQEKRKQKEKQLQEKNEIIQKLHALGILHDAIFNKRITEENRDLFSRFIKEAEYFDPWSQLVMRLKEYEFDEETQQNIKSISKYAHDLQSRVQHYLHSIVTPQEGRNSDPPPGQNEGINATAIAIEKQKIKLLDLEDISQKTAQNNKTANVNSRNNKIINIDFTKRYKANLELGLKGELIIVELEKSKLSSNGLEHLLNKVRHVSLESGDGAGYDILSYDENGDEIYIEVKTTINGASTQFYFTENELNFIKNNKNYYIYRLNIRDETEAELIIINRNDFWNKYELLPQQYIVKLKNP